MTREIGGCLLEEAFGLIAEPVRLRGSAGAVFLLSLAFRTGYLLRDISPGSPGVTGEFPKMTEAPLPESFSSVNCCSVFSTLNVADIRSPSGTPERRPFKGLRNVYRPVCRCLKKILINVNNFILIPQKITTRRPGIYKNYLTL